MQGLQQFIAFAETARSGGFAAAARMGMGLCQLPAMIVQDDLARGELVELLPSLRPAPMPIQLVYPSGRLLPARVTAAIEALQVLGERVEA